MLTKLWQIPQHAKKAGGKVFDKNKNTKVISLRLLLNLICTAQWIWSWSKTIVIITIINTAPNWVIFGSTVAIFYLGNSYKIMAIIWVSSQLDCSVITAKGECDEQFIELYRYGAFMGILGVVFWYKSDLEYFFSILGFKGVQRLQTIGKKI